MNVHFSLFLILQWVASIDSTRKLISCLGNRVDHNGSDFRYSSKEEYTSDMCAQCYGYIQAAGVHMREARVGNRTVRFRPLIPYMVNNTGVLCETRDSCFFVMPDNLNRANPDSDRVLKTLTSDFYRVWERNCGPLSLTSSGPFVLLIDRKCFWTAATRPSPAVRRRCGWKVESQVTVYN